MRSSAAPIALLLLAACARAEGLVPDRPALAGCPLFAVDHVRNERIDILPRYPASDADVWPARHVATSDAEPALPPMDQRCRLRADADLSGFSEAARVVACALVLDPDSASVAPTMRR